MNIYSKPENIFLKRKKVTQLVKIFFYHVNILDNSFVKKHKELPEETFIGLNILNKSYIRSIYLSNFVNRMPSAVHFITAL